MEKGDFGRSLRYRVVDESNDSGDSLEGHLLRLLVRDFHPSILVEQRWNPGREDEIYEKFSDLYQRSQRNT